MKAPFSLLLADGRMYTIAPEGKTIGPPPGKEIVILWQGDATELEEVLAACSRIWERMKSERPATPPDDPCTAQLKREWRERIQEKDKTL
jgi:hypothetical protein